MPTNKHTISVRLDEAARRQVEMAAQLARQSAGAFLGDAGEQRAHEVVLQWAVVRHRSGEASFSELAAETGLAVEEIMGAMAEGGAQSTLTAFLASCRTVAEATDNSDFLRRAQQAARLVLQTDLDR